MNQWEQIIIIIIIIIIRRIIIIIMSFSSSNNFSQMNPLVLQPRKVPVSRPVNKTSAPLYTWILWVKHSEGRHLDILYLPKNGRKNLFENPPSIHWFVFDCKMPSPSHSGCKASDLLVPWRNNWWGLLEVVGTPIKYSKLFSYRQGYHFES